MTPKLCRMKHSMGAVELDAMDSIDIKYSDPERLKMFTSNKGGTSTKNYMHMAQFYRTG